MLFRSSGLALAHNLYYGETFSFFTNRADPSQTIFQPAEIFQFFSNSVVRIATFDKFQKFFYWQVPSLDAFLLASWASQAVFLYALFRSLRVRRLTSSHLFLSTPVAYVISSIPFGIMNIPERQFTMATISTAIAASLSLILSRRAAIADKFENS